MSAETDLSRADQSAPDFASMGPRFDERGNPPQAPRISRPTELQWGRASMSAEMASRMVYHQAMAKASMGLRFDERGNAWRRFATSAT